MNTKPPHILVVDDEPDIRQLIGEILTDFDYVVTEVHDAAAARTAVRLQEFDAILLDIWMPGEDGITLLKEWYDSDFEIPVIMLSAHGSIETAVEATRYGAFDYLEKPVSIGRLDITVRNALSSREVSTKHSISRKSDTQVDLVGSSPAIATLRGEINRLSLARSDVFVIGEVGSGRTTVSRMIHQERGSDRNSLIVLDWQTKEIWQRSISDAIEEAKHGSILIRDIHTYDRYGQNQVLGLLNEIIERRVKDDDGAPAIFATTTESIYQLIKEGRFRPELFHRLNESVIRIPSLRDRLQDIPELVGYLVDKFSRSGELPYKPISTAALNCLRNHTWNGNIEELKNVLRKVIQGTSVETISDEEVRTVLETWDEPAIESLETTEDGSQLFGLPFREAKDNFEREYLRYHLQRSKSLTEVAAATGLHRASIFRKTRDLGIEETVSSQVKVATEDGVDS
ncbi:MAG: sigma-54-dependent Fis family transcriptional regulator [Gammaproteobacteria bacterium]|nr:sigma-54-dependent Fis family transcriptional regulator [Gammaproteobacteria bacterium]